MRLIRHALRAHVMALLLIAGPAGAAGNDTVPSQIEWNGAKQFVTLPNGINMAYVEMGNPQGKPLLLIHGYTDSSRSWSNMAPFLKDRRLIAIDLRGHGASTSPDCCYTMTDFANDVSLFVSAMKLQKVDVAGHSLGTMVSQTFSATHPEQVDRLILLAGSRMGASPTSGWLWENVMALQDPIDPDSKFMNDWYSRPKPLDPPEMDTYGKQEAAKIPAKVWKSIIMANTMTDLSTVDSLIKAKTLIVAGGKDGLLDATKQAELRAALPQAKFIQIDEAGHGLFKEYPERVAGMIEDFLGK